MSSSVNSPTSSTRDRGGDERTATAEVPASGQRVDDGYREDRNSVAVTGQKRDDGVRWGPIWAGVIVALAVFLVLEFLFFALGWLNLDPGANDPGSSAGIVSGILGLVAFFIGGLTAGKTAMWRDIPNGVLHGVVVAALGLTLIVLLSLLGGGALLGTAGNFASQLSTLNAPNVTDAQLEQAITATRHAAGWTALGLGLAVAAAALGGLAGARMHPGDDKEDDLRTVR